ncbi:MAG: aldo/keto reductase [Dehalococcoidia bacterium]|nr:aldo/keto reductase [Dehalococcoidia bacterium]
METRSRANERVNGIPVRSLGRTGEKLTVIGIGGFSLGKVSDFDAAVRIVRTALDEGVNFLDNCWCYHEGRSELIMGRALRDGYRHRVFLMSKTDARDGIKFERELHESLRRFETDCIDLYQFHNIAHDHEVESIFASGAIDAALKARDAGKIRFIGFSGHHWPHVFLQMLEQDFDWDAVQHPLNPLDARFRSFIHQVLPILVQRRIGVIGMKSLSDGGLLKAGVSPREGISYALSFPVDTLVSGIESMEDLRENLEIVRTWTPLGDEEKRALEERVSPWADDGRLERYKVDPE